MKKTLLITVCLFVSFGTLFAQRVLERKENTEALSIFIDKDPAIDSEGGAQAGAIISCPITLNLSFSSNLDRTIDVYKTEERGDVRFYYLRFIVGRFRGASYNNRILEVTAQGFQPLRFNLELQPSEAKSFEIFDPNATVGVGCFYQNFNEGVELFKRALYSEAREKYRVSMDCTDMPADADISKRISEIDEILILRQEGDKNFDLLLYFDALACYQKIVSYNIDDEYARNRANESQRRYDDNCKAYYESAELNYLNGNFTEAKKMYEMLVLTSCSKSTEASHRLAEIEKIEFDRNKRIRVIAYEFASGTPFGLTTGFYREKLFSGYFSFRLNAKLFEAMRKDYDAEKPEINVSAGWTTMKIQVPVWGFFGLGYTGVVDWDYSEITEEEPDPAFKMRSAISPEAGVLGKIGPVALRYTFQYRFSLDKDYQDYIGKVRHVFGIGFCF